MPNWISNPSSVVVASLPMIPAFRMRRSNRLLSALNFFAPVMIDLNDARSSGKYLMSAFDGSSDWIEDMASNALVSLRAPR